MRPLLALVLLGLGVSGCTGAPAPATTATPATTPTASATVALTPTATPTAAPTASATPTLAATPSPTPEITPPAISIVGDVVTINPDALAPLFYAPPAANSSDPFYSFHTNPSVDGFFLSVEAYTEYGTAWTGELGTFAIDCTAGGTGICVHFDPDGPGPMPNRGADFGASGDITFTALSETGYDITLANVAFSDGTTIPGPLQLTSDE